MNQQKSAWEERGLTTEERIALDRAFCPSYPLTAQYGIKRTTRLEEVPEQKPISIGVKYAEELQCGDVVIHWDREMRVVSAKLNTCSLGTWRLRLYDAESDKPVFVTASPRQCFYVAKEASK